MANVSDVDRNLMQGDIDRLNSILEWSSPESTPRASRGLLERILAAARHFAEEDKRKSTIIEQLGFFAGSLNADLETTQKDVEAAVTERDNLRQENEALKKRIAEYAQGYGSLDVLADSAEALAAVLRDEVAGDEPLPWGDELDDLTRRLDDRPTLEILPGEMPDVLHVKSGESVLPETNTNTA